MTETSQPSASSREDRILFVSDPSSVARLLLPDPVGEQDLRAWVDMVADSGVDILDQEVFSMGWTVYWRSRTYEYDRRPQHRRFLPLLDAGVQPLDILIDQAHRRGMRFVAGIRVNDNHAQQAREQGAGIAEFIESNPQLQLRDLPEGEYYQQSEPLDFSYPEVRDYTLGVIDELVERFDLDGVELCYRDHAYFPVDTGPQRADRMTELVRRIRASLDDAGDSRLLGARVFSTIEECLHLGLDVAAWIGSELLDYVSPQDSMYADFNTPYESWAALTRGCRCRLYPGLLPWTSFRARYRRSQSPITPANHRALAHTMYGAGADGIAVYNHFVPAVWHPPFYPQAMQIFHQLRDPTRVAGAERHYVFDPTWAGMTGFGAEGRSSTGTVNARRLHLDRHAEAPCDEYAFRLYEQLEDAHCATLWFRGAGLSEGDELDVAVNGHTILPAAIRRTRRSDATESGMVWERQEGSVKIPCFPERGRTDARPQAEPVFSTRWFVLTPDLVTHGENRLSVTLRHPDPDAQQDIVIDEVEIWVDPR
jgi:hypothetical protein